MYQWTKDKNKKKRMVNKQPDALMEEPEGQAELVLERPRKKKKPRKNVLVPSIYELKTAMRDMEEDLEDMIPLSQRTRVAKVAIEERRKSQSPPSPITQEHPIQVEELIEGEAYDELAKEAKNDEFRIEQFDFMLMGTTLKGGKIWDIPRKEGN